MRDDTTPPPAARDPAEWDAEIEAEFQRVLAADKAARRKKRGQRMVGAPFAFVADVCRLTQGRAPLLVAMLIYRRTCISGSRTVTLPGAELAELDVKRNVKKKALAQLVAAGLIRVERDAPGRAAKITLLWEPG